MDPEVTRRTKARSTPIWRFEYLLDPDGNRCGMPGLYFGEVAILCMILM